MNKFVFVISMMSLTAMLSCHRNSFTGRKQLVHRQKAVGSPAESSWFTGRKQLTLVSEKDVQSMALAEYQLFLSGSVWLRWAGQSP